MAPPIIAGVGLASSVGGSLLSAFGGMRAGQAQASQYSYQAGMAQLQKKVALQNRDYALQTGETEASQFGLKASQQAGKIVSAQSASGIDIGSGSSARVRESQKAITDIDMSQIRANATRKAYGYSVEAASDEAQAGMFKAAAKQTSEAIPLNLMSSLISGVGSVSGKWLQGQQAGVFPSFGG